MTELTDVKVKGERYSFPTGVTDYNELSNKPKINGQALSGDRTLPTFEDIDTEVADYVNAHKAELKGDKGDKGDPGKNGANGKDGRTPERGFDYWTDEDKAEIVNDVLNALPEAESEEF